ncbi:MAG: hypothetical protein LBC39_03630 [Methanobrevibacter sp.]|jgi:hypothetical protein|nr:hypothetical protein [Candidatus Methanovirga aequatorialis]
MKKRTENKLKLHGKTINYSMSLKGWSIVIMPENILIDNFHHDFSHIHPDRKEIKTEDLQSILILVIKHVNNNKCVNYETLRKELIK